MNKKRWMAAALAGAMALTMTACGGGTEETPADDSASTAESTGTEQAAGGEAKKVSVILKTLAAEYWQYCKAGRTGYRRGCKGRWLDRDQGNRDLWCTG